MSDTITPHHTVRAQLRAELDDPLASDFTRREKDGVPVPGDPRNVRLAMFRIGYKAAREPGDAGEVFLVGPHPTKPGETAFFRTTKERIANLRLDIHRAYGFLPSKALVKDVIEDVARAYDAVWTQEKGWHLV